MSNETQTRLKPHRGIFVFTFGILSFIGGFFAIVFGPIAWISGRRDLKEMNTGVMDNSDGGLTQAGQVLGMITTIFWALVLILGLLGLGIVALMVPSVDHFGNHGEHDSGYYDEDSADGYGEEMMMDEYGHYRESS
jgi:hypothetical protein